MFEFCQAFAITQGTQGSNGTGGTFEFCQAYAITQGAQGSGAVQIDTIFNDWVERYGTFDFCQASTIT